MLCLSRQPYRSSLFLTIQGKKFRNKVLCDVWVVVLTVSSVSAPSNRLDEEEMNRRAFNLSPFSVPQPTAVSTATTVSDSQDAALTTEGRSQEVK